MVDSLRVIGVRAEPPEIKPGGTALLSTLLLDPSRPGQKNTVLWLGCPPDPYGAGRGACSDTDALQDPTAFADARMLPPGVSIIGLNDNAAYSAPANLFDVLAADDPRRKLGTVGLVVQMAIAADIDVTQGIDALTPVLKKVSSKEIPSQLTLFRVTVSESDAPNHNPFIDELTVNGAKLPSGATIPLYAAVDHVLDVTAHDFEEYDEQTPMMGIAHKTERIIVAWYTTAGRFDHERVAVGEDVKAKLTAAGDDTNGTNDPVPPDRRGTLWAVARDSRGGQVWKSWPWWICDPATPLPSVTQVDRGAQLTLHGDHLEQILDVLAESGAVRGGYSAATKTWVGDAASGPLRLQSRSCIELLISQ